MSPRERLKCLLCWMIDRFLNIDTQDDPKAHQIQAQWLNEHVPIHNDPVRHDATTYWILAQAFTGLDLGPDDVLYDLGCGKGRTVCFVASRYAISKVVGIEFFEPLCAKARDNARRLRGRKAEIEIRREDVVNSDLRDGTVYFLFNPFGIDTLRDVLKKIGDSLEENPREVSLVYYHPKHQAIFESCSWLKLQRVEKSILCNPITFWVSRTTSKIA